MHNTAVGQSLDQLSCQSGFTTISYSVDRRGKKKMKKMYFMNGLEATMWLKMSMVYILYLFYLNLKLIYSCILGDKIFLKWN